jgi:hypothetical protein
MTHHDDATGRQAAFATSRVDRDRTLQAMHRLEAALAMAAEGENWLTEVTTDLEALEAAMVEEQMELNRPDALLAMITAGHPRRFSGRIRNLREQYDDITRQVASLRNQLTQDQYPMLDPGDLRRRASWILQALHHCRNHQTDIVYEAIAMDLGER